MIKKNVKCEDQYKSSENSLIFGFFTENVVNLQSKRKEDGIRL